MRPKNYNILRTITMAALKTTDKNWGHSLQRILPPRVFRSAQCRYRRYRRTARELR